MTKGQRERRKRILGMLAEGKRQADIARILLISPQRVHQIIKSIIKGENA